jgi:uncharacterized repeat protein (TIGR03803 family)
MRSKELFIGALTIVAVTLLAASAYGVPRETVLYNFTGGNDGRNPFSGLTFDKGGNLYGTTSYGGDGPCDDGGWLGCGVVFELTPQTAGGWTEKVLYSFQSGADGNRPMAGLTIDPVGNLYGTTYYGGGGRCNDHGRLGCGVVFELTPQSGGAWKETVLHAFHESDDKPKDGAWPAAGLVFDKSGNLYGTTYWGGSYFGGTVFELSQRTDGHWNEKVVYSFCHHGCQKDGAGPYDGLIFDPSGNLWGTAWIGGAGGVGTVFELLPRTRGGWNEKTIYNFREEHKNGYEPHAGLIFGKDGDLYGTTIDGGLHGNDGTVFRLAPRTGGGWAESVVYSFSRNGKTNTGYYPVGGLVSDSSGNLYGTTFFGGGRRDQCDNNDCGGTVFELSPSTGGGGWKFTALWHFDFIANGQMPYAGLVRDASGNLYGTTAWGGSGQFGTVFEITP